MDIPEVLREIERFTGRFPKTAVEAAEIQQAEIVPHLLRILEDTVKRAEDVDAQEGGMAHIYAMFLLAQFRETRAYPFVIQLASLPAELLHSLFGDFITEDLGRVVASVCDGDLGPIKSVIENEDADEWARGALVTSLLILVAVGRKSRDEIVSYFAQLFGGRLKRTHSNVWDELASSSVDLCAAELERDIEKAYRDGLIDPGFMGFDEVGKDLAKGQEVVLERLKANPHRRLIESTVKEMQWWACFQKDSGRKQPKIGRNNPCPCGSGKKFKKCCGA